MAVVNSRADASVDQVWAVLSDPYSYKDWVVGAKEVRGANDNWPAAGSALHHSVGFGLLKIKDSTTVVEVVPRKLLKLNARVRPLGAADITLELRPVDEGTEIVMVEEVVGGPVQKIYGRVLDLAMRGRNLETLRRLGNLAKEKPV